MDIFVTGGSGFVGQALIRYLTEQGHKVKGLARSSSASAKIKEVGGLPVLGNLEDVDSIRQGMASCEAVIHSAAIMRLWGNREEMYRVNVGGTERVLQAAKDAGIKRFVYISAGAVLAGGRPVIDADETLPIPSRHIGIYPETKAKAESLVLEANSPGFETLAVRPVFIWGAGDPYALPLMIDMVKAGKFKWIDHGKYPYVTCHVRNVCEGAFLALEQGLPGETYFLTDGAPIEFRELITQLLQTQGVDPGDQSVPRWVALLIAQISELLWRVFRIKGAPPITRTFVEIVGSPLVVKDDKARRELGYQAHVSREAGLEELRLGIEHIE